MDLKKPDLRKPNRRRFLKGSAAAAAITAGVAESAKGDTPAPKWSEKGTNKEIIAYGERSRFVTSVRVPVAERHSPDAFGLMFHVLTPAAGFRRDHHAVLAPLCGDASRLLMFPISIPKEHRLMIHGMVDRPLIFTMDDLSACRT